MPHRVALSVHDAFSGPRFFSPSSPSNVCKCRLAVQRPSGRRTFACFFVRKPVRLDRRSGLLWRHARSQSLGNLKVLGYASSAYQCKHCKYEYAGAVHVLCRTPYVEPHQRLAQRLLSSRCDGRWCWLITTCSAWDCSWWLTQKLILLHLCLVAYRIPTW